MKKVLLKFNVGLYGFLYSIALVFYGYVIHRPSNVIPLGEEECIVFPIIYLILLKVAKAVTDEYSSTKTCCMMAAVTLVFSAYSIMALAAWQRGSYYFPVIYPFANLSGSALIIVNYLICAVKTWKENKERGF